MKPAFPKTAKIAVFAKYFQAAQKMPTVKRIKNVTLQASDAPTVAAQEQIVQQDQFVTTQHELAVAHRKLAPKTLTAEEVKSVTQQLKSAKELKENLVLAIAIAKRVKSVTLNSNNVSLHQKVAPVTAIVQMAKFAILKPKLVDVHQELAQVTATVEMVNVTQVQKPAKQQLAQVTVIVQTVLPVIRQPKLVALKRV